MSNADVLKLVQAGFSEDTIIAKIRESKRRAFQLDPDGLIELKTAGVTERVIRFMLNPDSVVDTSPHAAAVPPKGESATSTPAKPGVSTPTPAGPGETHALSVQPPGIYFARNGSAANVVALEPTVFSQAKANTVKTMFTYGIAKTKWRAVVSGAQSHQRLPKGQPTFYFIFEQKNSGISGSGGFAGWLAAATSPNEFVLAEMTPKRDSRELVVGEFNLYTSSTGTRSEDVVPLEIEKIAPGVYRVKTTEMLESGEFCFFYAAGVSAFVPGVTGKLFDFGIDPKSTDGAK